MLWIAAASVSAEDPGSSEMSTGQQVLDTLTSYIFVTACIQATVATTAIVCSTYFDEGHCPGGL
jgi:hypothetical protein